MADVIEETIPPDEQQTVAAQEPSTKETEENKKETEEGTEEKQKPEQEAKTTKTVDEKKDAKKDEESQPIKLEISSLKKHYNIHNKSTLRHVLTEYGFEDKNHKDQKKSETRKKKKKKVALMFDEQDEDEKRRKQKEEVFRQKFGDNRSTDKYYAEYLSFLERKVQQQRLENMKRKEEELKREKERQEEEMRERHLHKRLQRVELTHDDGFLRKLPKTDLAMIVELESKLKREGKLKTQSDRDKFWDEINQPEVFYSQFKKKKSKDSTYQPLSRPTMDPRAGGVSVLGHDGRSLSHISERQEISRLSHHDNWAITQQFTSQHGKVGGDKSRKDSTQLAREAALELEKRFPKLEMPKMSCFSLSLGEKPPDPEEIQRQLELKSREKSRKKHLRKLRKMHQLAMAHSAAANRILAERGDLDIVLHGANLRDVRGYYVDSSDLAVFREDYVDVEVDEDEEETHYETFITEPVFDEPTGPQPTGSMERLEERHSAPSSAGSSRQLVPVQSAGSSRRSSKSRGKKKMEAIEAAPVQEVAPLTYTDILSTGKIVEAKCLSTNWTNYMHAGKSVFSAS